MTQNVYDDPGFFDRYSRLRRSIHGLQGAPEWPALRALVPPLAGRRVLDLGCGFGWFCRWAHAQRATYVQSLDVSENMLAQARTFPPGDTIRYALADLEQLSLPARSFDVAYSALALHYVNNLGTLLTTIHRALIPQGHLVFSIEHPVYMAVAQPGWSVDPAGRKTWPVTDYLIEGPRTAAWLGRDVIKHHRTIGTTLNLLIEAGFTICHVQEWGPSDQQIAARPQLAEERIRPMFLLVSARSAAGA